MLLWLAALLSLSPGMKTYVLPEQVHVTKNRIWVDIDHAIRPIPSLLSDSRGLYFIAAYNPEEPFTPWECPECGHSNHYDDDECRVCDAPNPDPLRVDPFTQMPIEDNDDEELR